METRQEQLISDFKQLDFAQQDLVLQLVEMLRVKDKKRGDLSSLAGKMSSEDADEMLEAINQAREESMQHG
jgi:hypothetical protein